MASPVHPSRQRLIDRVAKVKGKRPLLRTHSEAGVDQDEFDPAQPLTHTRHKSTATAPKLAKLSSTPTKASPSAPFSPTWSSGKESPLSPRTSLDSWHSRSRSSSAAISDIDAAHSDDETIIFDFSKSDYELDQSRKLGVGLWSIVYLCRPKAVEIQHDDGTLTPPATPRRHVSLASSAAVFAVKMPSRKDAVVVLGHEARMLSHLGHFLGAAQYIVPFFGLDRRNEALVFEAVIGGSLADLCNRLQHMTELARHQEVVSVFPSLALDLISGLEFMHDAGIVHADIKPQNILLDVSDHYSLPAPVIRARYIDFSAAFLSERGPVANAGGTWDYMAPEQMRSQKDLSRPTFASDIWSLGISLLTVIVLGSPYTATCGNNMFMLREAIKTGDPLSFARNDPKAKQRMDACQMYIDCCKLALQKDRDRRVKAIAWRTWLENHW